jgi:hypothetical protein
MNIIKQTGGNVILVDAAGNILKSFVNVNALDIVSNNEIIIKYGFNQWHSLFASQILNTQIEPAAAIPFSGDAYALAALLSSDFFYPSITVCADAQVDNSDASYSVLVASGGSLILPDSDVEVNSNLEGQIVSVKTIDIQLTDGVSSVTPNSVNIVGNTVNIEVPAAVSRTTAQLMKTGQTTSYRTGDDGDLEAGRNTSFTVLAENNPFGNTNRFTDELGGSTYTNNIVIDWSTYNGATVLGYKRTDNGVNITWDNSIDGALAVSLGTFTTGWRLPNINEIISICNWSLAASRYLAYSPFLLNSAVTYWSSTTNAVSTASSQTFVNNTAVIATTSKTASTSMRYFAVRTFTVTGTTLS